jgi:hypothetical protein
MISIVLLLLAIGCYTLSQLHLHKKGKWQKPGFGFFGEDSDKRKYKNFDSKQGERWPTSTNITIFATDLYHAIQALFFIFISISVSIPLELGWNEWWEFILTWSIVHILHAVLYKVLTRKQQTK